jgi:periodic tryptophan protein 1
MLSALGWIPRGSAKATPLADEPTEEELAALAQHAEQAGSEDWEEDDDAEDEQEENEDDDDDDAAEVEMEADEAVAHAKATAAALSTGKAGDSTDHAGKLEKAFADLDMDKYDEEDEGENLMGRVLGGDSKPGLSYYYSNDEDPYITLKEDSDSEVDDFIIRDTDLLLVTARHEDDVSNIDVWLYEEASSSGGEANLYVHHDIMLPAFPLCLAWMNYDPSQKQEKSNMVAVGTFDPAIEIWDLDVMDTVTPVAVMGGADLEAAAEPAATDGKKKKKKKVCHRLEL